MKALLLAIMLRICWGPLPTECGDLLGRLELPAGAEHKLINYYVVRLADGSQCLVEPELVNAINPKGR